MMNHEITSVAKGLLTLIALGGLLPGMNSQLERQSRSRSEALLTLGARVRSLTCLDTSMDLQITR